QILVLVLGMMVSFLTLFLLNTLTRTADKAKHLAGTLTASLTESETKLRQITENMSDVVFTTDQNLNTIYISPSIMRLTGHSPEDYLKLTIEQRHPKHSIERIRAAFKEEMINELNPESDKSRTRIIEIDHYKIDGSIITTSMHLSFIRDNDGQMIGIQGVTRDITEQKRAEKELHEKSSYLENLVNYANAPIIVWDSNNIITRFNGAFEQLTGRASSEVIGKNIELLFPDNSRESSVKLINLTKAGERWEGVEIEILCKDSSVKTLLWNSANIYEQAHGVLNATIAHGFDITEVKKTNAALLVAKERAEQSNRLKTAFINNISHEIRTPLNGIIGFGQLLNDSSLTVEERQSYYDMLKNSSDRLIQAIEDNLDIAQISSGTLAVNNTSFPLKPLLNEVIELAIGQTGRSAETEIVGDIPSMVNNLSILTDRELLRKALEHLVSNAVKFTEKGTITIGINLGEHSIEFYVSDTGIGIAPEKMEDMFRPYIQEVTDMTRGYEGSGLGLAIVKGIAELLDGDVLAESEKGVGTTFYFTIPRRELSVKKKSPAFMNKEAFSPGKPLILIAEDDESSYLFQSVVVKRAGYNVLRAVNGVEAVEYCKSKPEISLVLMDIKMPLLNGIEATEQIRDFRKDLPIIAVTAYAQSDDEYRILQSGCNDYITKPIKSETLLEKIRKFIT
ncbi:MAG: PAS domain S-box protein, partial [Bacteroidales bacterium]|nr:PAS domain S-box protein [Bacteroidales bacterium]